MSAPRRPLLGVSRATTRALGLPFADDPSNATGAYLRNRMRHDVMPLLAAENPQVERALADVADQARAELELIDALAGAVELAAVDLRGLRAELADVLLRWRWRREVGGAPPSAAASAQLAAQLVAGATAATSLGAGVLGRARRGRLAFEPAADRRLQVVAHGPGTYRLSALHLELEELSPPLPSEGPPEHAATAVVPADGLRWPLTIRRIEARARRGPGGLPTLPNAPSPLAPHDNPTGAPKAEFLITDALGERLWPPRPGAPPAPSQRWLCVRAHRCTTPGL